MFKERAGLVGGIITVIGAFFLLLCVIAYWVAYFTPDERLSDFGLTVKPFLEKWITLPAHLVAAIIAGCILYLLWKFIYWLFIEPYQSYRREKRERENEETV